jgi:hypothetical protein
MAIIINDTFTRTGDLHGSAADTGQVWEVLTGGGWITENGEASPVRPAGLETYPSSETALIDAGVAKIILDCTFLVRREVNRWEGKTISFYVLYKDADNNVKFQIQRNSILTYWQYELFVTIAGVTTSTTALPSTKYDETMNRVTISASRAGGVEVATYNTLGAEMHNMQRVLTSDEYNTLRAGTKVGIKTTNTNYLSFSDNTTGAVVDGMRERGFASLTVEGIPPADVAPPLHQVRNDFLAAGGAYRATAHTRQSTIWQRAML